MKDLLEKLTRATVDVTLKSGEELYDVVIERIVGNTIVANYAEGYGRSDNIGKGKCINRRITLIDIGHIAHVSAEKGIMELMKMIVSTREDTEKENKEENKDGKKEDKKEDKK